MAHAPVKHDPDRRDDRKDDRRDDRSDDRREAKVVGEEGSLVLPLAEPGPGEPLVGATGVKGEHIEDGERDPDTIAEEQRRRSEDYEANLGSDMPDARSDDGRRAAIEDPRRAQHTQPSHAKDDPKHADHHQSSRK